MTLPFTPGEYHIFTTRRIPLDFEITTSLYHPGYTSLPLLMYPSINDGHFDLLLPEELTNDLQIRITDLSGSPMAFDQAVDVDQVHVTLHQPVAGVYMVNLISGRHIYAGKVMVH
jgi:hypothetical protein